MLLYLIILAGSFFLLTGSALLALRWALQDGQLRNGEKAALLVFDEEEPLGEVTDAFPGAKADSANLRKPGPPP
jgi:hypothetical protein